MRLLDLHAHYPMHTHFPPRFTSGPPPVGKEIEYFIARQLLNYQHGQPRVSLEELLEGTAGGIGSVLYDPDDEFFRDPTPRPEAFPNLLARMDNVEAEIRGRVTLARNPAQVSDWAGARRKVPVPLRGERLGSGRIRVERGGAGEVGRGIRRDGAFVLPRGRDLRECPPIRPGPHLQHISSGLDGFIRPLDECTHWAHTGVPASAVEAQYGAANAEKILWRNAPGVLENWWTGVTDEHRAATAPADGGTTQ